MTGTLSGGLRKRFLAIYSPVTESTASGAAPVVDAHQRAVAASDAFKAQYPDVDVNALQNGTFTVKCKQPSLLPTTWQGFEQSDVIDGYAA